jgi:hypothetical protein
MKQAAAIKNLIPASLIPMESYMILHTIVRVLLAGAALTAAVFWFVSARIEVPDNINTIVRELQRIGRWNG